MKPDASRSASNNAYVLGWGTVKTGDYDDTAKFPPYEPPPALFVPLKVSVQAPAASDVVGSIANVSNGSAKIWKKENGPPGPLVTMLEKSTS